METCGVFNFGRNYCFNVLLIMILIREISVVNVVN
jgi:hypothetical protein